MNSIDELNADSLDQSIEQIQQDDPNNIYKKIFDLGFTKNREQICSDLSQKSTILQFKKGQAIMEIGKTKDEVFILIHGSALLFQKKSPENQYVEQEKTQRVIKSLGIIRPIRSFSSVSDSMKRQKILNLYKNNDLFDGLNLQVIENIENYFSDDLLFHYYYQGEIKQGDLFGQTLQQRSNSLVICKSKCLVGVISQKDYMNIFNKTEDKINKRIMFIKKHLFQNISNEALLKIVPLFKKLVTRKCDKVYLQGDYIENFYLIKEGEFWLYNKIEYLSQTKIKQEQNKQRLCYANLTQGEHFGEEEILQNKKLQVDQLTRIVSADTKSAVGKLYYIPIKAFLAFIQQKPLIQQQFEDHVKAKLKWRQNYTLQQLIQNQKQEETLKPLIANNSISRIKNKIQESSQENLLFLSKSIERLPAVQRQQVHPQTFRNQVAQVKDQIVFKFIKNQMMAPQLNKFQQSNLNNIPVNHQLLEKAVFKHKQSKESFNRKQVSLNRISQNTINLNKVSDLFYFGKLKGLRMNKIQKAYQERTSQTKPTRSQSHHIFKLQLHSRNQQSLEEEDTKHNENIKIQLN